MKIYVVDHHQFRPLKFTLMGLRCDQRNGRRLSTEYIYYVRTFEDTGFRYVYMYIDTNCTKVKNGYKFNKIFKLYHNLCLK